MGSFFMNKQYRSLFMFFVFLSLLVGFQSMWMDIANAAGTVDDNALSNTLCRIISFLNGKFGRGIAMFAIIFIGIGLFVGKISWGLVLAVGLGIGAIFGAGSIVQMIAGTSDSTCTAE